MKVKSCMSADVRLANPSDSIKDAARAMKEIDAGSLPVGEDDRLVGMITDRDIAIRAVAEGRGPDTRVRDAMSGEILYCFEDESVEDVARQMSDLKVRRMPVLNDAKRLVGVISLSDIARSSDGMSVSAEALSQISRPGGQHVQH